MRFAQTLHFPWLPFAKTNQALHALWDKLWPPAPRTPGPPGSFANAIFTEDPENVVLFAEWLRAERDLSALKVNPPPKAAPPTALGQKRP